MNKLEKSIKINSLNKKIEELNAEIIHKQNEIKKYQRMIKDIMEGING